MPQLLATLVGEGSTDDALMPIIQWALERPDLGLLPDVEIALRFVGPDDTPEAAGLVERVIAGSRDFPCDLLFVHHDADESTPDRWQQRIRDAVLDAKRQGYLLPPVVPVVPVREMEAWLLIDASAIRRVVSRPRGTNDLRLPHIRAVEACADPKAVLRDAKRAASELPRRRLQQIDAIRPRAIADSIARFEPLRRLPAFQVFEAELRSAVAELLEGDRRQP